MLVAHVDVSAVPIVLLGLLLMNLILRALYRGLILLVILPEIPLFNHAE
jgi:hypothetical protein